MVVRYGTSDPEIELTEQPCPKRLEGKSQLLLKVLACSTAFSDVHMLSGRMSFVLRTAFPYIPGKDVCGIVVESDKDSQYKVGDCVVSSRDFKATGGMAEFVVTEERRTCLKPALVNVLEAAACVDSSVTALRAFELARINRGERVLILGGSGGVGSSLVQLVRLAEPSFVASTSTQSTMLCSLGVDMVVDYRETNWWEMEEFRKEPFDVVFDCVGGKDHFQNSRDVLKSKRLGGRFVAIAGDDPTPVVQTWYQLLAFVVAMLAKPTRSIFAPWLPRYLFVVSTVTSEYLSKVVEMIESGRLRVQLDPLSPFSFTNDGVKGALKTQASGHAHGKIVVELARHD